MTSTTTSIVPESTTTTIDPEAADRAEIEDVIGGFFAYGYEVGYIEGVPGLEEFATSPIYEQRAARITELAITGHTGGEGRQGVSILSMVIDGDTAAGTVCRLDEAPLLDSDGAQVSPPTPDNDHVLDVVLSLTDSGWRVADVVYPSGGSTPCDL